MHVKAKSFLTKFTCFFLNFFFFPPRLISLLTTRAAQQTSSANTNLSGRTASVGPVKRVSQLVEGQIVEPEVAGSIPVTPPHSNLDSQSKEGRGG